MAGETALPKIFARREVRAIELATKILAKVVRINFNTIENQNATMLEWWTIINQRLDRLEAELKRIGVIER